MTKKEKEAYSKAFGAHLRSLRLNAGFGKREFAREADIEYSLLGRIEAGESNPTLLTIIKISNALAIHPSELMAFFTR